MTLQSSCMFEIYKVNEFAIYISSAIVNGWENSWVLFSVFYRGLFMSAGDYVTIDRILYYLLLGPMIYRSPWEFYFHKIILDILFPV